MKKITYVSLMLVMALTSRVNAVSTYLGTDDQLIHGPVTSTSTVIRDTAGDALGINADGSINASVTASTTTIQASGGKVITADVFGSTTALNVIDIGSPNLRGKSLVYTSSSSMVVGGGITLNALIKNVNMETTGGKCTYNLNGGDSFQIKKENSKSEDFGYAFSTLTVNLVAKDGGATCQAEIFGAQ